MANGLAPADKLKRVIELRQAIDHPKGKPKDSDLAEFRRLLAGEPAVWRILGDMSQRAERMLKKTVDTTASTQEALEVGLSEIRRELGYPDAPMLERMLIDQVALCWLRLGIVELHHAAGTTGSIGIPQADYLNRALSSAQRGYLRAIETLARVRRLLRPSAVQVNIGAKQVNVVQAAAPGKPHDANG